MNWGSQYLTGWALASTALSKEASLESASHFTGSNLPGPSSHGLQEASRKQSECIPLAGQNSSDYDWGVYMRTLLLAVGMVCLAGVSLLAQDSTKAEVFGGYQFFHSGNIDGVGDGVNANGFDISGTVNLRKQIGLTADFGYASKGPGNRLFPAIHISTYTFGPTASMTAGSSVKLFAHALFGGAHSPTGCYIFSGSPDECGSGYHSGFTMMFGGGADLKLVKHIALRLGQFDWVYFPTQYGAKSNTIRVSTGLVGRF